MSQPWEPPGQQPPGQQRPPAAAPSGSPEDPQQTTALPPTHPGHQGGLGGPAGAPQTGPPAYPPYRTHPGAPANPYAPPPYAGGPPQAGPAYPGYQAYGSYQPYATQPPVSGVTTITASVIQLLQCAFWLVVAIVLVASAGRVSSIFDTAELDPMARSSAKGVLIGVGVLIALVAGGMATLAVLTLRRVNGCRIASAVVQIVFGVLPLVGVLGAASDGRWSAVVFPLLFVASCAAVATLFLMPASARYCQTTTAPRPPRY